jgi:hypothetical protein
MGRSMPLILATAVDTQVLGVHATQVLAVRHTQVLVDQHMLASVGLVIKA